MSLLFTVVNIIKVFCISLKKPGQPNQNSFGCVMDFRHLVCFNCHVNVLHSSAFLCKSVNKRLHKAYFLIKPIFICLKVLLVKNFQSPNEKIIYDTVTKIFFKKKTVQY